MPRTTKPLTDSALRVAKPKVTQYKLFDGQGLFLLVLPSGGKVWRFKYRFNGKDQQLSLGAYPAMSLAEARKRRDEARKAVAEGRNQALRRGAPPWLLQ